MAMKNNQTLAGFDIETDLKLGLMHQQMKVTKLLKELVNNVKTPGIESSEGH